MGKRNLYVRAAGPAGRAGCHPRSINHGAILAGAVVTALGYGMKENIYFSMQADPVDYVNGRFGVNTAFTVRHQRLPGKGGPAHAGGISESFWHGVLTWGGVSTEFQCGTGNQN